MVNTGLDRILSSIKNENARPSPAREDRAIPVQLTRQSARFWGLALFLPVATSQRFDIHRTYRGVRPTTAQHILFLWIYVSGVLNLHECLPLMAVMPSRAAVMAVVALRDSLFIHSPARELFGPGNSLLGKR